MADEAKGVAGRGLGFFTDQGVLKTKEQLAKGSPRKAEESKRREIDDGVSSDIRSRTDDAFQRVESRFVEKANRVVSQINTSESSLKEARKVVNDQISAAKDLKDALKTNNDDKAREARERLAKLQERREELAQQIERDNRESAGERVQNLNLGNEQKKTVRVGEIRFTSGATDKPEDIDEVVKVNKFIDSLKDDRKEIRTQLGDLQETKKEVKVAIKEARQEIDQVRKTTIRSFDEADKTTSRIAQDIRSGGIAALEQSVSKSLTPENVARLVEQSP